MRNPIQQLLDKYLEEGKIISICEYKDENITFTTSNDLEWTLIKLEVEKLHYCDFEREDVDEICYQLYDGPVPTVILCKDCLYDHLLNHWNCFIEDYLD